MNGFKRDSNYLDVYFLCRINDLSFYSPTGSAKFLLCACLCGHDSQFGAGVNNLVGDYSSPWELLSKGTTLLKSNHYRKA